MHDQKMEKAAAEYFASVNGYEEGRWRSGEVIRHLVAFGEQVRREAEAEINRLKEALAKSEDNAIHNANLAVEHAHERDDLKDEVERLLTEKERLDTLLQNTHGVHSSWVAEVARLRTLCRQAAKVCNESLTEYDGFEDRMRDIVGRLESAAAGTVVRT